MYDNCANTMSVGLNHLVIETLWTGAKIRNFYETKEDYKKIMKYSL